MVDTRAEYFVEATHPVFPGVIECFQGLFLEMLENEVSVHEPEASFDLAFGSRMVPLDYFDSQTRDVILEVRKAPGIGRLEVASSIAQDYLGQTVTHEGSVQAGKDVNL